MSDPSTSSGVREAADTVRKALPRDHYGTCKMTGTQPCTCGKAKRDDAIAALDVLVAAAERAETLEAALWEIICCADKHAHLAAAGAADSTEATG